MKSVLFFDKPQQPSGRIRAFCGAIVIGVINPLADGRATWSLTLTDDRGQAKTVDAAEGAVTHAFAQWLERAGLVQDTPDAPGHEVL